jgi:CubicO group peptidase (beta-lactamase class C family)
VWSDTYQPGEHAMYANVGFDLISYLVELLSGEPFLLYCQQHIFDPLGMWNTSFNLSRLPLEQVAIPYQYYQGTYYKINELDFLYGVFTPPEPYWRMRSYPAGGLYTTVHDLSHFLIAHMNQGMYQGTQILKEETIDLMHMISADNEIGYGLAWMEYPITLHDVGLGHGGDIMGVDTWMLYLPEEHIGMIYFANGNPVYGETPLIGSLAVHLLMYTLFQKEKAGMVSSSSVVRLPLLRSFMIPPMIVT